MNKVAEHNLTKLYYTIGEVAEMFDVNTSLIRFWEKEFQVIAPKKNRKGNRLFTPKDIVNINKIYYIFSSIPNVLYIFYNILLYNQDFYYAILLNMILFFLYF